MWYVCFPRVQEFMPARGLCARFQQDLRNLSRLLGRDMRVPERLISRCSQASMLAVWPHDCSESKYPHANLKLLFLAINRVLFAW
jgi:hypothetical protein